MNTAKIRKMDMINGLHEISIYTLVKSNSNKSNFFRNIVPDIVLNQNINYFIIQIQDQNECQRRLDVSFLA